MRALQQYMNTLEQRGKKGRRSADEDTPRRDESVRARQPELLNEVRWPVELHEGQQGRGGFRSLSP